MTTRDLRGCFRRDDRRKYTCFIYPAMPKQIRFSIPIHLERDRPEATVSGILFRACSFFGFSYNLNHDWLQDFRNNYTPRFYSPGIVFLLNGFYVCAVLIYGGIVITSAGIWLHLGCPGMNQAWATADRLVGHTQYHTMGASWFVFLADEWFWRHGIWPLYA